MASRCMQFMRRLREWRTFLIIFLTPIVLSPLPLIIQTKEARTGYAILIMGIYWCTEVTNLTVTALLPLFLFPVLSVIPAKEISTPYFKDTNILVLGGLMMAVAIERWNVHKRISLKVLLLIGTSPRRLMLGFMIVTAFISMWITNTATTAMMTPIMEAVLKQLDEELDIDIKGKKLAETDEVMTGDEEASSPMSASTEVIETSHFETDAGNKELIEMASVPQEKEAREPENLSRAQDEVKIVIEDESQEETDMKVKKHKTLCVAMTLCICYAANIGGTGTLTGTTPQQILAGQLTDVFEGSPGMSFLSWSSYAFPEMLIFLGIAWVYLQAIYFGIGWKHLCCCFRWKKRNTTKGKEVYALMKRQYADLGPITFAEYAVFGHFLALVLCWIFRDPKFIPGWAAIFPAKDGKSYVSDSTAGVLISFSMFLFPSERPQIFGGPRRTKPHTTLLEWKAAQTKFPWNVTLLLGSGFAIATACEKSGLSMWLGCQLAALSTVPNYVIVLFITILLTFLTEFTSNTATATILLPVLASLAQSIQVHPYYLMVPAAVCASFAFMLPVAGPSNAIVFATGRITILDMMKAGFGMNLIGIIVVNISINTYGVSYFDLGSYPAWAVTKSSGPRCAMASSSALQPTNATMNATTTAIASLATTLAANFTSSK